MKPISYEELLAHCEAQREADRFCRCSSSCSGAGYYNIQQGVDVADKWNRIHPDDKVVAMGGPCGYWLVRKE